MFLSYNKSVHHNGQVLLVLMSIVVTVSTLFSVTKVFIKIIEGEVGLNFASDLIHQLFRWLRISGHDPNEVVVEVDELVAVIYNSIGCIVGGYDLVLSISFVIWSSMEIDNARSIGVWTVHFLSFSPFTILSVLSVRSVDIIIVSAIIKVGICLCRTFPFSLDHIVTAFHYFVPSTIVV